MKYIARPKNTKWFRWLIIAGVMVVILGIGAIVFTRRWYTKNLGPVSASQKTIIVTIPKGASLVQITHLLKNEGVIKSEWAFQQYVRTKELQNALQAGTYSLRPSQSVSDIVAAITEGKIASNLVTIKPGSRLDQVKRTLVNAGFSSADVEAAMNPDLYKDHPALVDKPASANLEGYLYPDSFQKTADSKPQDIIKASLDEMQKRLTPVLRAGIAKQGLSVHEGIILGSIIEQEVSHAQDRSQVAQVFIKRLRQNIELGSDVTAFYGAIVDGKTPSVLYDSAYNTHYHKGLPPGPISNVSVESLQVVANPATTDWLFFVSGDDGTTYFSKTLAEHQALTEAHCKTLCSGE